MVGRSSWENVGLMEMFLLLVLQMSNWENVANWARDRLWGARVTSGLVGLEPPGTAPGPCFVKRSHFKFCARKDVRARRGSTLGTTVHFSDKRQRNYRAWIGVLLCWCFLQEVYLINKNTSPSPFCEFSFCCPVWVFLLSGHSERIKTERDSLTGKIVSKPKVLV